MIQRVDHRRTAPRRARCRPAPQTPSRPRPLRGCIARHSRGRPGRSPGYNPAPGPTGRTVGQKLDQFVIATNEALIDGFHRHPRTLARCRHRRGRTSFARPSRSGTRRWRPIRAACRRRNRRGDTTGRPSHAARCSAAVGAPRSGSARRSPGPPAGARCRRNCIQHFIQEKAPAKRFRLCRCCRPGSCRHSSRRSPSAASRVRRSAVLLEWR